DCWRPACNFRDREVVELCDGKSRSDAGRRPVGIRESRAWQHLGTLRSRGQYARHTFKGRDSGSWKRVDGYWTRESKRIRRSVEVRRGLGIQRTLWCFHAADVSACPCLEPAEPGQQIPYGRVAYSGGTLRA